MHWEDTVDIGIRRMDLGTFTNDMIQNLDAIGWVGNGIRFPDGVDIAGVAASHPGLEVELSCISIEHFVTAAHQEHKVLTAMAVAVDHWGEIALENPHIEAVFNQLFQKARLHAVLFGGRGPIGLGHFLFLLADDNGEIV